MMNKTKTRFGAWKMLAALPVAALLLMVGCKPAAEKTADPEEVLTEVSVPEEVLDVVEVMPEFNGGMEALYAYLSSNIQYPEQAKQDGVQGRVIVRFVVESDGSVTNAEVLRGIREDCDQEALRVVQAMPKWKAGMQEGKPVAVHFNLPITFKLQ